MSWHRHTLVGFDLETTGTQATGHVGAGAV